jgi:hypothetical protein
MSTRRRPWDEEDEDKTPYGVSGEALPPRPDVVGDADMEDRFARPRRKKAEAVDDDAEAEPPADDPPVRKKKRRKRDRVVYAPDPDDERAKENEKREWLITGTLFVVGFAMLLIGTVGLAAKKDFAEVGTAALVVSSLVSVAIAIPVTLVALIVGGSILGIEYGSPVSAVRNIAGIFLFLDGLNMIFAWAGMPAIGWIVSLVVGFSLLMNRFDLDIWELWATVFAMRVVGFAAHVVTLLVLSGIVAKKDRAAVPDVGSAVTACVKQPVPGTVFSPTGWEHSAPGDARG